MILGILTACVVAILLITFWPTPVDRPFNAQLMRILGQLHHAGLLVWVSYGVVESISNVVMFVPFGALVALYFAQRLWWTSVALGFALSLCIEFGQYLLLPARFASVGDVVANTLGAFIGGGIIALIRVLIRARADARSRRGATLE
jgi:glycopeptide antibiotics resistance protein